MTNETAEPSRRAWLKGATVFLAGAPVLLGASAAWAAASTSKADVKYQFTPHAADHCSLCTSYIPSADGQGSGTCKIVAGAIQPDGWCFLFAKK